jgi:hypothetical protein
METKLNRTQKARWEAAKKLYLSLIKASVDNNGVILFGSTIIDKDQIIITDSEINIIDGNCTYNRFIADPDTDAGLYTTVKKYEKEMREDFFVSKKILW